MLLKEMLASQSKQQNDLAKYLNVDNSYISKICNYRCLPLPTQAKAICEYLDCNILDIYNKKEIDLILGTKKASKNIDNTFYYRLSVRLNRASCKCLKIDNLKLLGYNTIKEWVLDCINDLNLRLKEERSTRRNEKQKRI